MVVFKCIQRTLCLVKSLFVVCKANFVDPFNCRFPSKLSVKSLLLDDHRNTTSSIALTISRSSSDRKVQESFLIGEKLN